VASPPMHPNTTTACGAARAATAGTPRAAAASAKGARRAAPSSGVVVRNTCQRAGGWEVVAAARRRGAGGCGGRSGLVDWTRTRPGAVPRRAAISFGKNRECSSCHTREIRALPLCFPARPDTPTSTPPRLTPHAAHSDANPVPGRPALYPGPGPLPPTVLAFRIDWREQRLPAPLRCAPRRRPRRADPCLRPCRCACPRACV